MRTLGKLKLMVVGAVLLLGMSSCFKNDDKFVIYPAPAYVLQEGNSRYQLQIQIQGNESIKSATASFNGKNYSFSAVPNSENYYMQLSSFSLPLDSIAAGLCQISATNVKGESAVSQVQFESTDKNLGELTLTKLTYTGTTNSVSATWNKVENADSYYLLYRLRSSSYLGEENIWLPYMKLTATGDDKSLSANASIPFSEKGEYEIAIGATYKTTLRVSDRSLKVTGGTNASIN